MKGEDLSPSSLSYAMVLVISFVLHKWLHNYTITKISYSIQVSQRIINMQNSFEITSLFLYYRLSEDAFRPLGRNFFFFFLVQDVKLYILIHLNVDDIMNF